MERAAKAPGAVQHIQNSQDRPDVALSVNPEADALIREVMIEHNGTQTRAAMGEGAQTVRHPRRTAKPPASGGVPRASLLSAIMASLNPGTARRPSKKLVLALVVLVVMVLRPLLIPVTLIFLFLVILIAYFSLGPDRVAELVVAGWNRLNARRPDQAEMLRQKAEDMAVRIDAFLDKLPGDWTDGVHVPDFSKPDTSVDDLPDPFERLAKDAQRG